MASSSKQLVSVIVLGENSPYDQINEQITNVFNQTHKNLDVILSITQGRTDLDKLKERWNSALNLRIIETGLSLEIIKNPLQHIRGNFVFYKSVGPSIWMPRHIEHHLDLFQWDQKAQWSFSFIELKNLVEQNQPINVLNWRIEQSPDPNTIIVDELCHLASFNPEWDKFVVSFDGGRTGKFFPGACLQIWRPAKVAIPEEITVQSWVDPRPPKPEFGKPISDQNVNEEVITGDDGQLAVKVELPTLVGSSQWNDHNRLVLDRLKEIPPEKIKKIALKRTIGMGDVILTEPVIRALRKKYSNAEITLFTSKDRSCAQVVQYFASKPNITVGLDGEGELTRDFLYNQKGYDLRIDFDLSYESRKNINYIDAYFLTAGFKDEVQEVEGKLQVVNPIPNSERVPQLVYKEPRIVKEFGIVGSEPDQMPPYVAVELAGSGWPGKEWDVLKWSKILNRTKELGYNIAFTSNQKPINGLGVHFNPTNDFNVMMNYVRHCEFFLGSDCGSMHLAAALGKKCFVVAGAAIPYYTTKNPNVYQCVHPNLQCLHCKGRQYYNPQSNGGITFVSRCELQGNEEYSCMKKLEESYVLEKFNDFYSKI